MRALQARETYIFAFVSWKFMIISKLILKLIVCVGDADRRHRWKNIPPVKKCHRRRKKFWNFYRFSEFWRPFFPFCFPFHPWHSPQIAPWRHLRWIGMIKENRKITLAKTFLKKLSWCPKLVQWPPSRPGEYFFYIQAWAQIYRRISCPFPI